MSAASTLLPSGDGDDEQEQQRAAVATLFERGAGRPGRPHQVDAVVRVVSGVRRDCLAPPHAPPANYLLQHAAGSGKSLTIAALAAALLQTVDARGGRFHTVLVVNDRLQLDRQLGDTVVAFIKGAGFPDATVARASSSSQLRDFLAAPLDSPGRPRVILTTIQKLSSLWRAAGGSKAAGNSAAAAAAPQARIAVVADEAHRHHGNSTSEQLSAILAAAVGASSSSTTGGSNAGSTRGASTGGGAAAAAVSLVRQPRCVTYVGFTATPGPRALQLFGVAAPVLVDSLGNVHQQEQEQEQQQADGALPAAAAAGGGGAGSAALAPATLYRPFHSYSLQTSVADGLVLDALQHYVTVTPRFEISGLQLSAATRALLMRLDAAAEGGSSAQAAGPAAAAAAAAAARKKRARLAGAAGAGGDSSQQEQQQSLAAALLIQAACDSRQLVAVKAGEIASQFLGAWSAAAAAGFKGFRAMVVVRSRRHVVLYSRELRRLLGHEQHARRVHVLLQDSGEPGDRKAAAAAAAGDMQRVCYGAFSGSVAVSAADARALLDSGRGLGKRKRSRSDAAGGDEGEQQEQQQQAGAGGSKQQRRTTSGWDAALAGISTAAAAADERQSDASLTAEGSSGDGSGSGNSSGSGSGSGSEDSESGYESGSDSSACDESEGVSEQESDADAAAATAGRRSAGGGSTHLFGSVTEAGDGGGSSSEEQENGAPPSAAAAAVGAAAAAAAAGGVANSSSVRKRPRRDASTLSTNTAAAGRSAGDGDDEAAAAVSSDRRRRSSSSRQQAGAAGRDAAATAANDEGSGDDAEVSVSEADINAAGCGPGDARLLVVCNKYETGYDDPRLAALFVDRVLSGARAVQVLGRINRPAPNKAGCLLVVDFVNTAGSMREAFSEFYGTTTHCTGAQAKRRRQQQGLDDALSRILELLQPAAARHRAAALLQQQQQQPGAGGQQPRDASSSSTCSGHLTSMSAAKVAALARALPADAQRALQDDLSTYCTLCGRLQLQKLEFPLAFASALLSAVTQQRQRQERLGAAAAAVGAAAAREAAAAVDAWLAPAAADAGDGSGGEPAAQRPGQVPSQQQHQQEQHEQAEASTVPAAAPSAAALQRSLGVSVRVCTLDTTFAGPVRLQALEHSRPSLSVRLGGRTGAAAAAAAAATTTAAAIAAAAADAAASPELCVRAGRPLGDVIAAANAQLTGRYEKQVAAGLRDLCDRVRAADSTAAAAASQRQQQGQTDAGAAAVASPADDSHALLSLLRRLQLWPVNADLLRTTSAGKHVAALRKHSDPQVASLAEQVVAGWKASLAHQAAAAAAAKAQAAAAAKAKAASSSSGGATQGSKAAAADGSSSSLRVDAGLRAKVVTKLRDALLEHRRSVLSAAGAAEGSGGGGTTAAAAASKQQLDGERPKLQQLAERLEAAVQQFVSRPPALQQQPSLGAAAAAPAPAPTDAAALLHAYKSRVRALAAGLRHADGVSAELLSGQQAVDEVAALDSLSLAPAAVRAEVQERQQRARRNEEAWEGLMAESLGGGGTFVSTDGACPSCGEKRAQVHTILSGGTYAQERQTIQKFVCQGCSHTWRSDE